MTEATITTPERSAPTPREVRLPPTPPVPRLIQGLGFTTSRKWTVAQIVRRCGDVFTLQLPVFGRTVIVADPALAKELFMANTEDVGNIQPNLSRVLGSGSVFALDGTDHRRRRRLLTPRSTARAFATTRPSSKRRHCGKPRTGARERRSRPSNR